MSHTTSVVVVTINRVSRRRAPYQKCVASKPSQNLAKFLDKYDKMGFTRFVEVGRVALINFGENQGRLCTIVDILDGQKVSISDWLGALGQHSIVQREL